MKIGAHISTSGGLPNAVDRAVEMGAEAMQIFISSPRSWSFKAIPESTQQEFRDKLNKANITSLFFHGVYLISLASQSKENLSKSINVLTSYMQSAEGLGANGVVFHTGSHRGVGFDAVFKQAVEAIEQVLSNSPKDVLLIIENSAGMGDHICSSFKEIGKLTKAVSSPQLKVCLDTQHLFAAGHEITDPQKLDSVMQEFDTYIGLSNLAAVHANDSKTPFASSVDRHENIGEGHIGLDGFRTIMSNKAFDEIPFLLEVPGFEGNGPDRANIDLLKMLRSEIGLSG